RPSCSDCRRPAAVRAGLRTAEAHRREAAPGTHRRATPAASATRPGRSLHPVDRCQRMGRMAVERERAKLFDREAERYDRTRPAYPDELIDDVLGPTPEGLAVLDVACGSGIASRQMIARGAQVMGVDLNEGMAR